MNDMIERALTLMNGAKVALDRAHRLDREQDKDPTDSLRQAARSLSSAAIIIDEYLEEV